MIKLGMCTDLMNAEQVARAGFDYVESSLTALSTIDEQALVKMRKVLSLSGIGVEAMNLMIPGSYRLTGPDVDLGPARQYLESALDRAASLGVKVQVFGSGGARNVPEGWSKADAMDQLCEYLAMAGAIAAERGIDIAIEPLHPGECNIINTVSDALELVACANIPNVGVLADWYHMSRQSEGVGGILAAGDKLLHCHVANPEGRRFPLCDDGCDLSEFFDALHQIGYQRRVSVEGTGAAAEFASSATCLRSYVER